MKTGILLSTAALAGLLASCTPYPDTPPPTPPADVATNGETTEDKPGTPGMNPDGTPIVTGEGGTEGLAGGTGSPTIPTTTEDPTPTTNTKPNPTPTMQVAKPVPGRPGFVFSPHNNRMIDVKGIPSGTLVQDPTYPPSEKKYFRVP